MTQRRRSPDTPRRRGARGARPAPDAAHGDPAAPAPHGSRPDLAYRRLRDLIVTGEIAAGSRIVETEIAARLGISRTPVREALQRLQQEGYVLDTPGAQQSRLTVAPLTRDDVQELLNVLGALEGVAARVAAARPAPERETLGRSLRAANADFLAAGEAQPADHEALYEADDRIHHEIIAAGAGKRLRALHAAVHPQAERYVRMYITLLSGDVAASVAEHEAIIAGIVAGRADDAERAIATNWRHAAERLSRIIAAAGTRGAVE